MYRAARRLPVRHMMGVPSTSLGVQDLWWRPVSLAEAEEVGEEDWCRHTGGTGTVAGIVAGTVGIGAFADSTLCKTWSEGYR